MYLYLLYNYKSCYKKLEWFYKQANYTTANTSSQGSLLLAWEIITLLLIDKKINKRKNKITELTPSF